MEFDVVSMAQSLQSKATGWERFRSCQAWVSNLIDGRYRLIKSYRTIVGLIDNVSREYYEIGKYSSTTSKQVTQIYNAFYRDFDRMFVDGEV